MKLKILPYLFTIPVIILTLSSCQKEIDFQEDIHTPPGPDVDIQGKWTFSGFSVISNSNITLNNDGNQQVIITDCDYLTANNTGRLDVTDNYFMLSGISFTIDDNINAKTFENSALVQDTVLSFNFTSPVFDNAMQYVKNSTDSVTFTVPLFTIPTPSSDAFPIPPAPAGAKLSNDGSVLTIEMKNVYHTIVDEQGVPTEVNTEYQTVMTFRRD